MSHLLVKDFINFVIYFGFFTIKQITDVLFYKIILHKILV